MTKIEKTIIVYKCDRCGKEADKRLPKDWRHVELSRGAELYKVKDYCLPCSGVVLDLILWGYNIDTDREGEKEELPPGYSVVHNEKANWYNLFKQGEDAPIQTAMAKRDTAYLYAWEDYNTKILKGEEAVDSYMR